MNSKNCNSREAFSIQDESICLALIYIFFFCWGALYIYFNIAVNVAAILNFWREIGWIYTGNILQSPKVLNRTPRSISLPYYWTLLLKRYYSAGNCACSSNLNAIFEILVTFILQIAPMLIFLMVIPPKMFFVFFSFIQTALKRSII